MREIADVSMGWDKKLLPQLPYQEQVTRSAATNDMFSEWNSSGSMNRLNSWFVRAMLALHDKDKADTCVVEVRKGMDYAAEHTCENGDTVIVSVNAKGQISGCKVDTTDHYSNLVISKTCKENLTPLYACYIMLMGNMNVTQDENVSNRCKEALSTFLATEDILDAQKEMFYLNDTLYTGFKKEKINGNIQNGSINQIMKGQISGRSGKVICGTPKFLNRGANGAAKAKVETFGTVKAEFEKFAKTRKWSKTEEKLIPNFPDNYPVLPEVKTITKAYAESREAKRPFNNILWRGTTAYGKSTGGATCSSTSLKR